MGNSSDCIHFAEKVVRFEDSFFKTSIEDREKLAIAAVQVNRRPVGILGVDVDLSLDRETQSLMGIIAKMRRNKDRDEIATISQAAAATEAGYRAIASQIRPGLLEIELYSIFQAAASVHAGWPMGELGNDYRGGQPGGRPRPLPLLAGDLIPIDAGAVVGGYYADLCRTFAISGQRSSAQEEAFGRVAEALSAAEALITRGIRCRDVFNEVHTLLYGKDGWGFDHHLGHGIGLEPVERPFINAESEDVFQDGDTFTLEPGLYGHDLRAGIRLEQNYVLKDGKLQRLSNLQLDFNAQSSSP